MLLLYTITFTVYNVGYFGRIFNYMHTHTHTHIHTLSL